jgi:carboxyl-terminal processing protease
LTTARYYTPSGRSIQKPYENGQEDYFLELAQRFEHGEFVYADSIRFPDSLRYQTRGGRVVYGGGGIMPDIFVPWDSTEYTDLYAELIRTGVINDIVLEYVEENRSKLKETYPDIHRFKDFVLPASVISSMRKMADERQVVWSDKEYDLSATLIQSQLKALIARNLFDISAYFQVILRKMMPTIMRLRHCITRTYGTGFCRSSIDSTAVTLQLYLPVLG